MASIVTICGELAALTLSGVTKQYTYPPNSLTTANLPASFVMPPSVANLPTSTCTSTDDTFTLELVVAIEPTGQSTQSVNYAAMMTMIDTVNTALKSASLTDIAWIDWTIAPQNAQPIFVGQGSYWGITATVNAHGG